MQAQCHPCHPMGLHWVTPSALSKGIPILCTLTIFYTAPSVKPAIIPASTIRMRQTMM